MAAPRHSRTVVSSSRPIDRYVVIGNPVSHSLSPSIHARFARDLGERIEYSTLLAPLHGFQAAARRFFDEGGMGANVTLPFKVEASRFASVATARASAAGAANFLARRDDRIEADNTDGAGLIADLERNHAFRIEGRRILLLGAGGAARGVIMPLLERDPELLLVANRTLARAEELVDHFRSPGALRAAALGAIPAARYDLVLNATSTSTLGERLALDDRVLGAATLAYDMAYGPAAAAFLDRARAAGARACDGLGMLVEQAAESFFLWRGRRPETAALVAELRSTRA
jgi:shikimate dehydrogenase